MNSTIESFTSPPLQRCGSWELHKMVLGIHVTWDTHGDLLSTKTHRTLVGCYVETSGFYLNDTACTHWVRKTWPFPVGMTGTVWAKTLPPGNSLPCKSESTWESCTLPARGIHGDKSAVCPSLPPSLYSSPSSLYQRPQPPQEEGAPKQDFQEVSCVWTESLGFLSNPCLYG